MMVTAIIVDSLRFLREEIAHRTALSIFHLFRALLLSFLSWSTTPGRGDIGASHFASSIAASCPFLNNTFFILILHAYAYPLLSLSDILIVHFGGNTNAHHVISHNTMHHVELTEVDGPRNGHMASHLPLAQLSSRIPSVSKNSIPQTNTSHRSDFKA